MNYTPNQEKKTAYLASLALIIPGIASFLLAPVLNNIFILQFFGVACCSASLYILYRYALIFYTYTVDEEGLLTVSRVSGKRTGALARIPLSACSMLVKDTDDRLKGMKFRGGRFSYTVNMTGKERYVLVFKDGEDNVRITLEGSADLARALSLRLPPDAITDI